MSGLLDRNGIAAGDPEALRAEAEGLRTVTDTIDVVVRLLRAVSTHGVWESGAGETFAGQVGEVPDDLDLVCARLADAARVLDPYADLLEENQWRLRDLDDRHAEAARVRADRDRRLDGLTAEHPDRPRLEAERGEAAREAATAAADFAVESDEALADERRAAGRLSDIRVELADPRGYDAAEGATNLGSSVNESPLSLLGPVSAVGAVEPIGLAVRRAAYGEGSWQEVAEKSLGTVSSVVGFGAARAVGRVRRHYGAPAAPETAAGGRVLPNPIAGRRMRDIQSARTPLRGAAQTLKHDAADRLTAEVRQRTGIEAIERFEDDWAVVAGHRFGEGVVAGAQVVTHVARSGKNVADAKRRILVAQEQLSQEEDPRPPGAVR